MTDFFFQIAKDAINYGHEDTQAELYALSLDDAKGYMENILTEYISNDFLRQAVMADLCELELVYKWWRYVQDRCFPEKDEEEDDDNSCGCCRKPMPQGDTWCCEGECGLLTCPDCRPDDDEGACVICQQEAAH